MKHDCEKYKISMYSTLDEDVEIESYICAICGKRWDTCHFIGE